MIEINPRKQDQDEINVQRAFWVAIIFTIVAASSVGLAIFLITSYPVWQVYVMAVTTVFSLGFDLAAVFYIRRERPALGLKILYWSGLFTLPINTLLFEGVAPFLAAIVLVVGFVNVFLLFPKRWQVRYQFGPIVAAIVIFIIDYVNPPFRINLGGTSGNFGWIVLVFIVVATLVLIAALAWRGNIRTKLIVGFVGISALSMVVVATQAILSLRNNLTNEIVENQASLTTLQGLQIGQMINSHFDRLLGLSNTLFIQTEIEAAGLDEGRPTDTEEVARIIQEWRAAYADNDITNPLVTEILDNPLSDELRKFQQNFPENEGILLTDFQGLNIAATDIPSNYYQGDSLWWRTAHEKGEYVGQPIYNPDTNSIALDMAVPIYSNSSGEFVGVLRSTVNIAALTEMLIQGFRGQTGYSIIYHPHDQTISLRPLGESNYEIVQDYASSDLQDFSKSTDTSMEISLDGITNLASSAPVGSTSLLLLREEPTIADGLNWQVLTVQEKSEALQQVTTQTRNNLILAAIVGVAVIAVAYYLALLLTNPIIHLNDVATQVASGDLTAKAQVETNDEIGTLATTFNNMTSQLHNLVGSLEQQVSDRTRALETSTEVSRQLSTILDQRVLVREVVEQVRTAFNYYHAQIYLYDENKENLQLASGTGQAGQTMLERGHSVPNSRGLVGQAASTNTPILVPDVKRMIGTEIITAETVEAVTQRESSPADTKAWYANHISETFTNLQTFAEKIAQKKAAGEQLPKLGYILYGLNDFLKTVKMGAEEAAKYLGLDVEIVSADFDPEQGIRLFREMIQKGKDGLIVQPDHPKKWIAPIQEAVEAGIPVLTVNLRSPGSASTAWFGQDSYQSGVILGRELQKALTDAGKTSGDIVVASARDLQELHERYAGLQQILKDSDYTLSEFYDASLDEQQNIIAWEQIIQSHPDMIAAVGLASPDLPSLIRLKKRFNAQWVAAGYDLSTEVLEAIHEGIAQVTIGQHPFMQGYLPVLALGQYKVDGTPLIGWIVDGWQSNPLLPNTRAEAAIPIAIGENVFGVLDVQADETNGLADTDVDLLTSIANQVASALQNARTYQHSQQQVTREALIANINQRIQSTTDVEEALQVAVRELGRALSINTSVRLVDRSNGDQ